MDLLIVEDDQSIRNLLKLVARKSGCTFEAVDDGQKAIALAEQDWPRLVLLDYTLPNNFSGMDVWNRLIEIAAGRPVQVILLTAVLTDDDVAEAKARGAVAALTKPVSPVALAALIKETLAKS